jgi:hypothetical protein
LTSVADDADEDEDSWPGHKDFNETMVLPRGGNFVWNHTAAHQWLPTTSASGANFLISTTPTTATYTTASQILNG